MGPLRGDGNNFICSTIVSISFTVEKMGPLRGDGNGRPHIGSVSAYCVEKMGPLRGDGNFDSLPLGNRDSV